MVAAVLLAVTGCRTPMTAGPLAPSAHRLLAPVPAPARPMVGVYEPGTPGNWSGIARFSDATGVRPGLVEYYSPWNEPFSAAFARTALDHDAYVLVQLQPDGVTLASIAAGRSDAYLRAYAGAVVAFGHPVIVSFGHEMNGTWYSWGAGHASPATFVAAWRHIVRLFRAAGAANVTWLWTVNAVTGTSGALRPWWPGAAWVDWTGIDGYYYRATDTFGSVLGSTVADIRAFSRAPLLIAETAVGTTTDRRRQIAGLFAGVRDDRLAGVVWFDAAQRGGLYHQDWHLADDPAAITAFASAASRLGRGA
jgi:hypothetical protein